MKKTEIICQECGEQNVVLYQHPHKFAGVFSCEADNDCGASWSCEHPSFREEVQEFDTTRNGEHDTYQSKVLICNDCELDCTEEKTLHYEPDIGGGCEGCQ